MSSINSPARVCFVFITISLPFFHHLTSLYQLFSIRYPFTISLLFLVFTILFFSFYSLYHFFYFFYFSFLSIYHFIVFSFTHFNKFLIRSPFYSSIHYFTFRSSIHHSIFCFRLPFYSIYPPFTLSLIFVSFSFRTNACWLFSVVVLIFVIVFFQKLFQIIKVMAMLD